MTPDEQEELDRLCRTVVDEKNSAKLTEAVTTLNEFLEERERKKPNPGPPRRPGALGAKTSAGIVLWLHGSLRQPRPRNPDVSVVASAWSKKRPDRSQGNVGIRLSFY